MFQTQSRSLFSFYINIALYTVIMFSWKLQNCTCKIISYYKSVYTTINTVKLSHLLHILLCTY
jgi:hypothetical protein